MANATYIPRVVRANMHSFGKVERPHVQQPHLVHLGGGGGGGEARPRGMGGVGRGFGAGAPQRSGDPALTGAGFEKNPTLRMYGFPIAGGDLTDTGKAEKADYDKFQTLATKYSAALDSGSTPQEALRSAAQAVGGVPELGRLLFSHPQAAQMLQSVDALHGALTGAAQPEHFTQVKGPDGKLYNVPIDAETGKAGQAEAIPGIGSAPAKTQLLKTNEGFGQYDPQSNRIMPTLGPNGERVTPAGPAGSANGASKAKASTLQQMQELTNMQTVLENVSKLRNSISASGALGWGSINRAIAEHTPLSGAQAQAYNEAYNQMKPALLGLTRAPGISTVNKQMAQAMLDQLPDPSHAQLYNLNQVIPSIQNQMRERLAQRVTEYAPTGDNRPGAYNVARELAQTYDAHPVMMADLAKARQVLQTNPAQLTNAQVGLLKQEGDQDRLGYDDWARVQRQALQRGMINAQDFRKLVATNPDIGNVPQNEILPANSPYRKMVPQSQSQAPPAPQAAPQQNAQGAPTDQSGATYQTGPGVTASNPYTTATVGPAQPAQPQPQPQQAQPPAASPPGPGGAQADAGQPGGPSTELGPEGQAMLQEPVITPQNTQSTLGAELSPPPNTTTNMVVASPGQAPQGSNQIGPSAPTPSITTAPSSVDEQGQIIPIPAAQ